MIKFFISVACIFFPWRLKRFIYKRFFHYDIHPSSKIGYSLVNVKYLRMGPNSKIGHLNVIKGLTEVTMAEHASVGSLNWIFGFPLNTGSAHFADEIDRTPKLIIGEHSAITNRHLIDCTNTVTLGRFATFAGFRSQILTHSISSIESRQRSGTVSIGDFTFVGTASVILPNSALPNYSVLGAGAVLNKKYTEEYQLYAGNPARPIKQLDKNSEYFKRKTGYII